MKAAAQFIVLLYQKEGRQTLGRLNFYTQEINIFTG